MFVTNNVRLWNMILKKSARYNYLIIINNIILITA